MYGNTPIKTLTAFERSLDTDSPPDVSRVLLALWWVRKGDWNKAHETVQDIEGADAAWVHAHLHRQEGDLDNAQYWYRRAGREKIDTTLDAEWRTIVNALLRDSPERRA